MRGKKAKALRMLARYAVTADRPKLPAGGWLSCSAFMDPTTLVGKVKRIHGTCLLPKAHPRHKYQFLKKRYARVPLGHTLRRMHNSTKFVEAVADRIIAKEDA